MLDTINDYQTLKLFSEGKTEGVPNFDNERVKECLIKSKTNSLQNLCDVWSLCRSENYDIDVYCFNKQNPNTIKYIHPMLKNQLAKTAGFLLYREQLIGILQELANMSFEEANTARRAFGLKHTINLNISFENFKKGCLNNLEFIYGCIKINVDSITTIKEIWDYLYVNSFETISFVYALKYAVEGYTFVIENR